MKLFFAKYQRKLKTPFRYGNKEMIFREGILFRREKDGSHSYSEAAPLYGHSEESLEDVENELRTLSAADFLAGRSELPSLQFAADSLAESRILQAVSCNALLAVSDLSMAFERYDLLAENGFSVFKVKIHPQNFSLVLEFLKNIEGSRNRFRLDANGSLQESHLRILKDAVPQLRKDLIDYMEEPTANWSSSILENFPIALAADESLTSGNSDSTRIADVIIAKPTVIGGRKQLHAFLNTHSGKKIVFTSCLETEIGRRSLIKLISEQSEPAPAGLSVGSLFQDNFLPDQPVFRNIPRQSAQEALWLASLPWKELT